MAFTDISCVNDRVSGGIIIETVWTGELPAGLNHVELRRYRTGEQTYKVIYAQDVTEAEQLSYRVTDIEPAAGTSYTYECCASGDGVVPQLIDRQIVCRFDGIVLSDGSGTWHSAFGTSESRFTLNAQKNRPVSYIMTLSGKYPHRVSNSQANYWTGTCSALWLPYATAPDGSCVEPVFANADRYRLDFVGWLMSDTEKLMKTEDGKVMMISIDGSPQENYSPLAGMTMVTFDWTQTGDLEDAG